MYIQLGNFIFDKAFSPEEISHSDETSYAEHALISLKPRLQPTGNNLEEISLTITLRAEIVNVNTTLLALKKSKDQFEVLPFLYGNGMYRGDYVILKIEETIKFTLSDGTPVEVAVTISLKEYIVPDKLQQQQNVARKAAFGVGNKSSLFAIQKPVYTPAQITAKQLSAVQSQATLADAAVRKYSNNVSQQQNLADKIKAALAKMNDQLEKANDSIKNNQELKDLALIKSRIAGVKNTIRNFTFPITNQQILIDNNRDLQGACRNLSTGSYELTNLIITRNG